MENDINGCNISVVACLVRHVILVPLKHHCHHKGVESCSDLSRSYSLCHWSEPAVCRNPWKIPFWWNSSQWWNRKSLYGCILLSSEGRISFMKPDVLSWNSQLVSHLTQLNQLLIAPQQAYLRVHVWACFFSKQYLVQLIPWHPTCLPTPTTNRQRRCYIRGLGADPRGWGVCSVLVGMSEGLYKITKA